MSLFRKIHWVAFIQEKRWVIAKVSRRKKNVKIHKLVEFSGDDHQSLLGEQKPEESHELSDSSQLNENMPQQLKRFLKKEHIPLKKLKLTISCSGVITRIITLPILHPKDLEKLLTEQVDQYFTLNIEDYLIDYRVIEKFEEDGQQRQRILLAAIPRSEWEKLLKTWKELDFYPKVVDLAADSLSRLYSQVGWANGSDKKATLPDLAIVDLGPDRVEIVLLEHGIFFLYADLEVDLKGLEEYAKSLKNVQPSNILSEKLIHEGTSENIELNPQELTEIWAQNEMEGILKPVLQGLSDFLNFFASRHFGKSVDYLFITGYYSNVPLVQNIFEQVLEHETHIGFPEGWHPRFNKRLKPLHESWMRYGSLYGLALRED